MKINGFVAYVKQLWKNKPDTSTPVSAERLLHIEDGIKASSDAIEKIEAAVISQIINDPDKIASMAALYEVNQKVTEQGGQITQLNSEIIGAPGTVREFKARFPIMASGGSLYASYIWPRTLKNIPTVEITKINIDFYGDATGEVSSVDRNYVWIKITPPTSLNIENFNVYMGTIGLRVEF